MIELMLEIFIGIIVIGIPCMLGMLALFGIFRLTLLLFEIVCDTKDAIIDMFYDWKERRENKKEEVKKQKELNKEVVRHIMEIKKYSKPRLKE